jgi:hypothetical protein
MGDVNKVCKYCGSDNVWADATAVWDSWDQEWVLGSIFDNEYCIDCDGETTIIDTKEVQ